MRQMIGKWNWGEIKYWWLLKVLKCYTVRSF
jgi:hypothetical protein